MSIINIDPHSNEVLDQFERDLNRLVTEFVTKLPNVVDGAKVEVVIVTAPTKPIGITIVSSVNAPRAKRRIEQMDEDKVFDPTAPISTLGSKK